MKRFTPVAALCALTLSYATIARAGDHGNTLVSQAMRNDVIRACLKDARQPGYEIQSATTTVSVCFVSGEITRVDFFQDVRCNENGGSPCPKPAARLVASAEFGCNGELVSALCY